MRTILVHINKTYYENKCCKSAVADADLDHAIDSEVYKSKIRRGGLYGLTEAESPPWRKEIKIVEGKV